MEAVRGGVEAVRDIAGVVMAAAWKELINWITGCEDVCAFTCARCLRYHCHSFLVCCFVL